MMGPPQRLVLREPPPMRHERSRRIPVALQTAALLSSAACSTPSLLPGTQLGSYAVVGTLDGGTCGTGPDSLATLNLSVEVAEDGANAYAVNTDGTDEVSGTWSAPTATFTASGTVNPISDGGGLCALSVASTFTFTFDSPTQPKSLAGSLNYEYSVATTSSPAECAGALTESGGSYATLPCSVTYSLTGAKE